LTILNFMHSSGNWNILSGNSKRLFVLKLNERERSSTIRFDIGERLMDAKDVLSFDSNLLVLVTRPSNEHTTISCRKI
jgi:hypothetical protein